MNPLEVIICADYIKATEELPRLSCIEYIRVLEQCRDLALSDDWVERYNKEIAFTKEVLNIIHEVNS